MPLPSSRRSAQTFPTRTCQQRLRRCALQGSDTFGPDEFVAFLKGLPEPEAEGEGEEKKAEPLPEGAELQRAFAVFDEERL